MLELFANSEIVSPTSMMSADVESTVISNLRCSSSYATTRPVTPPLTAVIKLSVSNLPIKVAASAKVTVTVYEYTRPYTLADE